jgi:hypothetical protein
MQMELKVACPKCGKSYRWKPPLAGKKVQCKKCATGFRMPVDAPLGADDMTGGAGAAEAQRPRSNGHKPASRANKGAANLAGGDGKGSLVAAGGEANPYDLHDPEDQPKDQAKVPCRECGKSIARNAVVCVHCGINQRTGLPVDGAADAKGRKKRAKAEGGGKGLPLLKLGVGLLVLAAAAVGYLMFVA